MEFRYVFWTGWRLAINSRSFGELNIFFDFSFRNSEININPYLIFRFFFYMIFIIHAISYSPWAEGIMYALSMISHFWYLSHWLSDFIGSWKQYKYLRGSSSKFIRPSQWLVNAVFLLIPFFFYHLNTSSWNKLSSIGIFFFHKHIGTNVHLLLV